MSALQIKCYLLPESENLAVDLIAKTNEIRRFVLAQMTYVQLLEKIRASFASIITPSDEIKTYYLDEEDEFVCFSSDAELQYAVDLQMTIKLSSKPYESSTLNATSGVFKVFVRIKEKTEEKSSKSSEEQSDQHPGVVCDGCEKGICGIRYKCILCRDYDLCSDCRQKGIHSEHAFIPITKPERRCTFSGKHRGFHKHAWKHRFFPNHNFFQHQQQHQQQQSQQQNQSTSDASSSTSRRDNPLQDTLNNFLPYIANSIPIVNDPEQLKSVGEYLKQFFDPFGIDVSYYVDNINSMRGASATTSNATSASASTSEAAAAAATAATKEETPVNKADTQTTDDLMETASAASEAEKTLNSEILIPSMTPLPSSIEITPLVPSAPIKQDLIDLKSKEETAPANVANTSPFELAANALKNNQAPKEENSMASVAAATVASSVTTTTTSTSSSSSKTTRNNDETNEDGFNLVDIEKELKFINCIEQLRSMGYNDDAGWLTRLVIAKEGNINAVLDSLHPSK